MKMPLRLQKHILQSPRTLSKPRKPILTQATSPPKTKTFYYLTYNNKDCRDGAGAQIQRMLSLFILAKKLGFGYVHQQFVTEDHGLTPDILHRFNQLLELQEDLRTDFDHILYYDSFTENILKSLDHEPNKHILLVIGLTHTYLD